MLVADFPATLEDDSVPSALLAELLSISEFTERFDVGFESVTAVRNGGEKWKQIPPLLSAFCSDKLTSNGTHFSVAA